MYFLIKFKINSFGISKSLNKLLIMPIVIAWCLKKYVFQERKKLKMMVNFYNNTGNLNKHLIVIIIYSLHNFMREWKRRIWVEICS